MEAGRYVIRGGMEGRARLKLLALVMQPTTAALFERLEVGAGMKCLDVGCGGGDVAFELSRLIGPDGHVRGLDIDEVKLELARSEATSRQIVNVTFHHSGIGDGELRPDFDMVYTRFVLTHLADPVAALLRMKEALRPGGLIVVEDIDFRGHFCHPECSAFERYVELYSKAVLRRGGDPHIGPRLPRLLLEAGFRDVEMHVVQPVGMDGNVKLVGPITMENIADSVLAEGLAARDEIDRIIAELYEFARAPRTVMSLPRVIQAWGRLPE